MTLNHIRNQSLYNWFSLGIKGHTIYIHPFGFFRFTTEDADELIKFIRR